MPASTICSVICLRFESLPIPPEYLPDPPGLARNWVTDITKQRTALSRRLGEEPGLQQLGAMQKRITRKEIGSFLAAGLVGHKCLISRSGKANIYPKIIEERMIRRGGAGK
jgi:hypothetical protein